MENTRYRDLNKPTFEEAVITLASIAKPSHKLPLISFEDTITELKCSRSFIYKMIEEKLIKPKYIRRKPFFMIEEILGALRDIPY